MASMIQSRDMSTGFHVSALPSILSLSLFCVRVSSFLIAEQLGRAQFPTYYSL